MYNQRDLANPAVIIDSNHANSNKVYSEQTRIVREVLHSRSVNPDLANLVKGVMIESYIEPGSQSIHEHIYGKSITDPCLGWDESEKLIYTIADHL
jgi:3-deoxy-7-phosphoheptulonate synthase